MNTLDLLEAEAIYVLREVHAQFEHPALLFSGGKDSIVVTHLAQKAFAPGRIPMPLLHIDTGHNFPETLAFRDAHVDRLGTRLIVGSVEQSIRAGRVFEEQALDANRNRLQSHTLMETVRENRFDALVGGARRDEEKSRAKERFFSHRNIHGQWDPKNQRPELWSIFNGYHFAGEHFRVFPLNNWTETDVWEYILREQIALPSLYFAHHRECVERNGVLLATSEFLAPPLGDSERTEVKRVRFRTLGDITITGAIESHATTVAEVLEEVRRMPVAERGGRLDDLRNETSMEDRKREGYF
jgi:sulfate adenylyltransferase subunit 2